MASLTLVSLICKQHPAKYILEIQKKEVTLNIRETGLSLTVDDEIVSQPNLSHTRESHLVGQCT